MRDAAGLLDGPFDGARRRRAAGRVAAREVAEAALARAAKARERHGAFLPSTRPAPGRGGRRWTGGSAAGEALAARGRPARREGQHQRRGPAVDGRLEDPRGLRRAGPRDLRGAARRGRRRRRREDELRRVRHGLVERELGVRPRAEPVGPRRACRAARREDRPRRSRRARCRSRSGPTRAAPSANRPRSAASWAGSRPTGASRATA